MFARFTFCSLLVGAATIFCGSVRADEKPADPKLLEAATEKLLAAYNKDDAKAFFADYAKSVATIATPETYDALYKNISKKSYGDYVPKSLKLRKEGSLLMGDFLVVYFTAEFTKEKKALVSV